MTQEHHPEHHTEHKPEHHAEHSHNAMPEIPKVDMKNVNADALKGGFGDILNILKLDKGAMEKVAHRDSEGISLALVYMAIGAVAMPLGGAILGYSSFFGVTNRNSIVNALITAVLAIVMVAVVLYITSYVAEKMFQGKAKFPQYFRVMGYAYLLNVLGFLTIVPVLGMLANLWLLVVNYMVLTTIHKLNSTNAVLTIIVTVVAVIVLGAVIGAFGFTTMGGIGGGMMGLSR